MKLTQKINHMIKTGRKLALSCVILLLGQFFLRAQEQVMRIYYRFDSSVVDTSYLSNAQVFESIEKIVSEGSQPLFEIVAYSSPEGASAYNEMLSARRAEALRKHLVSRYPELAGKLILKPVSEAWDLLRENVSTDSKISKTTRENIIAIVDSYNSDDVKEAKLAALPCWRYLYANYFRQLRFAEIRYAEPQVSSESSSQLSGTADSADNNLVYFGLNSAKVDEGAFANSAALKSILEQLEGRDPSEISSIRVYSSASPDGPLSVNNRLCEKRGKALSDYIVEKYPALAGKISVTSAGEAWDGLRLAVDSDSALSDDARSEILSIIVSPAAADEKEAKLRSLPVWEHLFSEVFPSLRHARAEITFNSTPAEPALPATEPADLTDRIIEPEAPVVSVEPEVPAIDTVAVVDTVAQTVSDNVPAEPVKPVEVADEFRPMKTVLALKSNLLFDVATAFNFELEVPIKDRYSLMVEDVFPWWETGNKYCLQWWEMGIEARYWLKPWDVDGTDKLRGFFGGVYAMSGKYDLQYDRKINYQGEFWSAGVTAGYSIALGRKKWGNLEMSLGLGFLKSDYRHYYPADDYSRLYRDRANDGKLTWLGPTKAKVSLVIPINIPVKKEVSHE